MIKTFIIGPEINIDTPSGAGYEADRKSRQQILRLYRRQIETLNDAGFDDIDIINRDLSHKVRYEISDMHDNTQRLFLFIRYDTVLDRDLLYFVTHARSQSLILTARRISYLKLSDPIETRQGRLTASGYSTKRKLNIMEEFYGVAALQCPAARDFLAILQDTPSLSMSDTLDRICHDHIIEVICWLRGIDASQKSAGGGSYAQSRVVTRFRKEASEFGRRKLRDEIRFLRNLPESLQSLYPCVYAAGEADGTVYMEQEFLPLMTFRQALFSGKFDREQAVARLEAMLGIVHRRCYLDHAIHAPEDYLEQYHFQRTWHRLRHTLERAPVFAPLLKARKIWINGEALHNAPQLLMQLEASQKARSLITPDSVSPYVHGDLHFENIMVDPDSDAFRLVDPRGYDNCDFYYDLGKISHSTNGKYDFVHEDRFALKWETRAGEIEASLQISKSPILTLYDGIDLAMRKLYREITGDPLAEERTLFAEAMHFCTMMPFHLKKDGREDKAAAIYLIGVRLLNRLFEKLEIPVTDTGISIDPDFWGAQEWRNVG